MKTTKLQFLVLGLAAIAATGGCVSSRASRNGVFNENQYVRKAWLVRDGLTDANGQPKTDPGWMLQATVTDVSSPNPLGGSIFGIFPGTSSGGSLVHFDITQDKLNMVNMRELTTAPSVGRIGEVDNAWGITNVDLKYQVNLDGETTNFYQENQEAPWQDRQWLKINFAKNDMSDIAPLGPFTNDAVSKCTDIGNASATLVNDSFLIDETSDYMEWSVAITLPLKFDDATCVEAYEAMGDAAVRLGRYNVTLNLKYSMKRADTDAEAAAAYQPLILDEKDPIRHKYGPIEFIGVNRDEDSGQLAATEYVMRFNPKKPIIWYFEQGFPQDYKRFFTDPGGIADQTNQILQASNADARVEFREADDERDQPPGIGDFPADMQAKLKVRKFGDVRYNFLRWVSDRDMQGVFAGVTQFFTDPRSGETKNSTIVFNDFAIKDYYVQRIDAYLQSIGASADVNSADPWPDPGACQDGDTLPVDPNLVQLRKNASSSLFGKIQQYLQKPIAQYGNLAPTDFVPSHDAVTDFDRGYFSIAAYNIFGDPDANYFVTREGGAGVYGPASIWQRLADESEFHSRAAAIDHGQEPFADPTGPNGFQNALAFMNRFKQLTTNHRDLGYAKKTLRPGMHLDSPEAFSLETVIARDARRCVNGHFETKEEWVKGLIDTYWSQVAWHEFGHSLGLEHNFMASVDKPNFPDPTKDSKGNVRYGLYASSVMEYNSTPDRIFWTAGWAPYDKGAIGWIYANNAKNGDSSTTALSGQTSATAPWADPFGFRDDGTERAFLRCSESHEKYTPLCRAGDLGTTPSEIVANAIENYEWQYAWRNFRVYRKFWNNARYADDPAGFITDMKRFISMWAFDWSETELAGTLHRVGVNPPANVPAQHYYDQLTHEFTIEMSATNSLVAAFHKAVIQESSGERPYATVYDRFYGDELQQGIILDKLFAMQSWVGLWPTDNYDQNQAGAYIASYSDFGEPQYRTIAEDAVTSMVGTQYDVYPYFIPAAVALFAQDTHDPSFTGRIESRDWVGGLTFTRREDFITYFKNIAATKGLCATVDTCDYDATSAASTGADSWNEFHGPDGIIYIWSYVPDRNLYVLARKDRNIATYKVLHQFNDDILKNLDDGSGNAYSYELPIKYTLDAFGAFN